MIHVQLWLYNVKCKTRHRNRTLHSHRRVASLDELSLIAVLTAGTGERSVLKCGNEGKQSRVVWDSPRGGVIKDTP